MMMFNFAVSVMTLMAWFVADWYFSTQRSSICNNSQLQNIRKCNHQHIYSPAKDKNMVQTQTLNNKLRNLKGRDMIQTNGKSMSQTQHKKQYQEHHNIIDRHSDSHTLETSVRTVVATICFYQKINKMIASNHNHYARLHGYDYFILRKELRGYNYYHHTDKRYKHNNYDQSQKPLLIWNLLFNKSFDANVNFNTTYQRVLWIDFDAIFLNDNVTIEERINDTYNLHCIHDAQCNTKNISLIIAGDWMLAINAGVMIWQKNEIANDILTKWINLLNVCECYDKYKLLMHAYINNGTYKGNYKINYINKNKEITNDIIDRNINRNNNSAQCVVDDQMTLSLVLFSDYLRLTDALMLLEQLQEQMSNDNLLKIFNALSNTEIFLHDPKSKKKYQKKCSNVYERITVVSEQCLRIINILTKKYFHHVLWIEQSKLNSNIWSFYRLNTYTQLLKPWIFHAAGQNYDKNDLLHLFINYKRFIGNQMRHVSNDLNINSKVAITQETRKLIANIDKYIVSQKDKTKVDDFIKSKSTYDEFMVQQSEQSNGNPQCHKYWGSFKV